ncbi:uncharacterized protein LOC121416865 [Lytechinus variegatus]|uniref:uncharacterized protein LOC121416865 n=1 Tax=Lytechinus variegatus TaxID=7654 RepID=UPI001BB24E29|nr:uncharacterized protein LOC121416865 [Lytechinus variegatus]
METSRTKLRREVRERRLAYFERSLASHQPEHNEDALYHGFHQSKSPSTDSLQDRTKMGSGITRKGKSVHQQQVSHDRTRDDKSLSIKSSRPSSARSGNPRHGHRYPQGPSGDDYMNVTPLKRKKNRPSSAIPSARGDHYRLDIGDSSRLTKNNLRPSSAKAGARPKQPQRAQDREHSAQRPLTASVYRSSIANSRRRSEFEDFRKRANESSRHAVEDTSEDRSMGSDRELQDFFRLRENRKHSVNDMSPSSSESRMDAQGTQSFSFFSNQGKSHLHVSSDGRPDVEDAYASRSKANLEEGISRRIQSQLGSQVESEALQASEFHSAYSAENMLQSLLSIRKVKAKLHDELLSSFLENEDYESILASKRKSSQPRDNPLKQRRPDVNGNEVDADMARLKEGASTQDRKEDMLSPLQSASEEVLLHRPTVPETQESVTEQSVPTTMDERVDDDESAGRSKDEGEESGVEMDDLSFDVGALCNAAKQGDDILRQYIRGLTEKVKSKKDKETKPTEFVLEDRSSRNSGKIDSLFAPKMPERKFEEKSIIASVSEKETVSPLNQSSLLSYSVNDAIKKTETELSAKEYELDLQNDSANASEEKKFVPYLDTTFSSMEHEHQGNQFDSLQDPVPVETKVAASSSEVPLSGREDGLHQEEKESEYACEAFSVRDVLQEENSSVVGKVREPAVTADLLEKLGLFDSKESPLTDPMRGYSKGSSVILSHDADSSTDDATIQVANRTLNDSDLGLETFRPDSRAISPLKEVRDYSKAGVLTTSDLDSTDMIEEVLDATTISRQSRAETEALRRTYDLSEDVSKNNLADPNVNTPFHSHIQQSKFGVSFVFDPQDTESDVTGTKANAAINPMSQPKQGNAKQGVAFEVDLTSARKQPKPPPSSKPSNTRLTTPNRGSPKLSRNSPQRSRPRKSPRTPDAHRDEIRQYHEKDRRMRKLSSPRAIVSPVRNLASESSSTSENQPSLRLSLSSSMQTDRPDTDVLAQLEDSHDSLLDIEVGAPFMHSPRHEAPLEDENEVLDRISNFNPPTASNFVVPESQDTVGEMFDQNRVSFSVSKDDVHVDSRGQRQDFQKTSKPRPSSANPKRTATKKGNARPTSAHSKMYSSPDKSYDRKWPQSSMAWMTQHKLTSSLLEDSTSDLSASGSKVKVGQSRVNREFARKSKPPVAGPMSKRDGEFVRVRSSKLFDGTVSRVLEGRGSVGVPPLTLQLIQDSPRGSESLSIWQLLPDEILLHIFSHLPQHMLVQCALTCQRFHRIAMDDSLWRCIRLESRDLTDFYLTHIGEKHPVSLTLHKCRGNLVTENGLRNLFRSCADSLQELNVTGCSKGELQGDSILLHVSRCYNLTSLDTSWCAVTDNGLSAVLDGCPRLETICLNGCQSVSDQCLRQIVNRYGANLEVLELCGCFNLSPQTLMLLAETSNNLITLNIAQCYKITDECVASVAPKFRSLQHWQLKGCKELRDSAVKKVARHCKQLRTLSIASCPHVTDVALIEIATYLNSIRSLDVSGCRKIGNEGMRCLATCCPYLEKVGLSSTSATHKSVSSLASYASQTLTELKLNCCREITEASIIRLLKHCKKLKTLHLYGVKGLRNLGILKVQYPCIEYLEKVRPP